MLDQSYTARNFRYLLKPSDFIRFDLPKDEDDYFQELKSVEEAFYSGRLDLDNFDIVEINGKNVYTCKGFESHILLSKLNDNLRRLFKVKQADRYFITKQLKMVLNDTSPMHIIKKDIVSFYESIDREKAVRKVVNEHLLSFDSKKILNELFNNTILSSGLGMPRGLGISATLSEIYMRSFDKKVHSLDGIYYYARFVDDIIIVAYDNVENIQIKLNELISELELNFKKQKEDYVFLDDPNNTKKPYFDYLGYKYILPLPPIKKKDQIKAIKIPRDVNVSLADKKVKKIKSRIVKAFIEYYKDRNKYLLNRRIEYLTSNYKIPLTRKKDNLKGGIFFHYPLITDEEVLSELDNFLNLVLYCSKGNLSRYNSSLSKLDKRNISKYSFLVGFKRQIVKNYTPAEISDIKKCW